MAPSVVESFKNVGPVAMVSSDAGGSEEQRFTFYYKDVDILEAKLNEKEHERVAGPIPGLDNSDFKDKFRAGGGAKGKTGSTDFTRGKNAFVRPCTVGWKSQNQPLARGGGKRTPRHKG
jgi:hypothetical protein